MAPVMFHYTDTAGYKGIRSSKEWRFLAGKPPGDHPVGVYFTDYDQRTSLLAQKLRIPRSKLEFFLSFIFYSMGDYVVDEPRQFGHGPTEL